MATQTQRHYDEHPVPTQQSPSSYQQLKTFYDAQNKTGWFFMRGQPRACFTPTLLADIAAYFDEVKHDPRPYDFLVLASDSRDIFNLGGDLDLFSSLIKRQDRQGLLKYAKSCIDVLYDNMIHLDKSLTTIALVKGDALGGGFEAALSSNILIAERGVKLGLPEVLFNLFPGMGAYSLLSRKIGTSRAQEIILSGKLYLAEELFDMGVVDILAEEGEAEIALSRYIKMVRRAPNSHHAMRQVKDRCHRIPYEELFDITTIWVDAALALTDKDLKMMARLVKRQSSRSL